MSRSEKKSLSLHTEKNLKTEFKLETDKTLGSTKKKKKSVYYNIISLKNNLWELHCCNRMCERRLCFKRIRSRLGTERICSLALDHGL